MICTPREIHSHPNTLSLYTPTCTDGAHTHLRHTDPHLQGETHVHTHLCAGRDTPRTYTWAEIRASGCEDSEAEELQLQQLRNGMWFTAAAASQNPRNKSPGLLPHKRCPHRERPLIFSVYLLIVILFCVLHKHQKDRNPTILMSCRLGIKILMTDSEMHVPL